MHVGHTNINIFRSDQIASGEKIFSHNQAFARFFASLGMTTSVVSRLASDVVESAINSLMLQLLFTVLLSPVHDHPFHVLAFFTARNDKAHISFVNEANRWFTGQGRIHGFNYDTTSNWTKMNDSNLAKYDVIIFLDTRPDTPAHRQAFERYMKNGGGWLGFHFAGFALTPSAYPQNWHWYHNQFIGAGEYASNTWRPTSAMLKVEKRKHAVSRRVPKKFRSSPNEWYRWKNDLTQNKDIQILVSIDPSSFPLGTGPKPHEIWHSGYYPVVWTNKKYRMVYMNMGHNDIDYEGGTNRELSRTFDNEIQNRLVLDALLWLGRR